MNQQTEHGTSWFVWYRRRNGEWQQVPYVYTSEEDAQPGAQVFRGRGREVKVLPEGQQPTV